MKYSNVVSYQYLLRRSVAIDASVCLVSVSAIVALDSDTWVVLLVLMILLYSCPSIFFKRTYFGLYSCEVLLPKHLITF